MRTWFMTPLLYQTSEEGIPTSMGRGPRASDHHLLWFRPHKKIMCAEHGNRDGIRPLLLLLISRVGPPDRRLDSLSAMRGWSQGLPTGCVGGRTRWMGVSDQPPLSLVVLAGFSPPGPLQAVGAGELVVRVSILLHHRAALISTKYSFPFLSYASITTDSS